jgi:DNA mismatch repair protein MutL
MPQIKILPENLSNKIAAGEVVERPASVVKELLENALDAGADRVVIEVEKGGRSLIQVSDNGIGMSRDDALLSIERYATSKIFSDDDLFAISTLGFRGEALPSIASVSRFSMVTRQKKSDSGIKIDIAGGKINKVSETGAPTGTLVSVRQLFYNTPARRKFLKSITTEMGHIVEAVSGIALGWPGVRFRLLHNGRVVKNWPGDVRPVERVADVLGKDLENNLCQLKCENDPVFLSGWIAAPAFCRSTSRGIYVYVNGRMVKDRVIQHALFQGYAGRIVKGQFPLAVLFVRVPNDRVDVNVHPAKNEIRFADQKIVHDRVRDCVAETLRKSERTSWGPGFRPASDKRFDSGLASERPARYYSSVERASADTWRVTGPIENNAGPEDLREATGHGPRTTDHEPATAGRETQAMDPASPLPKQQPLFSKKKFSDLKYVGQFRDTYLIFESNEGLVIVDQHAAHERIVYEQLKRHSKTGTAAQMLLVPETLHLNFQEAAAMQKMIPELGGLGFEVEPFGGETYVVKSVPAALSGRQVAPLFREMLDAVLTYGDRRVLDEALDDCIRIVACHSAVRANQAMKPAEIQALMKQLDACESPSNCPHGRPTWVAWPISFLERQFKRIV